MKVGDLIHTPVLGRGLTEHKVTTLERYSSGSAHGGIDIGRCPIGTEVRAPFDGRVVAISDGVPNNLPGARIYPGKPSNWILLLVNMRTNYGTVQPATLFFQHLSPDLAVRLGSKVKRGQLLGRSGNSGNSTGPHLHLGGQWVRDGRGYGAATRYDHVNMPDLRIWPPDRYLDMGREEVKVSTARTFKVGRVYKTPLTPTVKVIGDADGTDVAVVNLPAGGAYLLTFQCRMPKNVTVPARGEFVRLAWPDLAKEDDTGHGEFAPAQKLFDVWHRWVTLNHEMKGGGPVAFRIYMPPGTHAMRFVCKAERIA